MLRGIYTGTSAMVAQQTRMDVVANNIANVDTTGYKKDTTLFKSFPSMLIHRMRDNGLHEFPLGSYDDTPIVGRLGTGVEVNEVFTRHDQGALVRTESPFDMAIEGEGFFAIETPYGERYTRDGSFLLNRNGYLVTAAGDFVMGQDGPIHLQKHNFKIDEEGWVLVNQERADDLLVGENENDWADAMRVDRLKIVNFEVMRELKKEGHSFYRETRYSGPPHQEADYQIRQGYLEKANVNIVNEMVNMIEVQRTYEASQKAIAAHDETLDRLINRVGASS